MRVGAKLEVDRIYTEAIHLSERILNLDLKVLQTPGPAFRLTFNQPELNGLTEEQRGRLQKDNEQLEKVVTSSKRQLENEVFVSKAPAKVIDGMRTKLAEYEAQLAKNKAALGE
jgi:hypothetical protein